jgi:hypothetical protein
MVKVRLILMFQGKVEHDIKTQMIKPRLKEVITIPEHGEHYTIKFREHYTIKFIQHMFDENGEFQYIMVTGIKKV